MDYEGGGGGNGQVYLSTDLGDHWTSAGIVTGRIHSMATIDGYLLVGARGVWRRPLSELITSVESYAGSSVDKFQLEQNYPNPFNSGTTIHYFLPSRSHVTLEIFDVLGRKITTLVDEIEAPGYKSVYFNASMTTAGVYYYRLRDDRHVETKKLILLK